MTTPLSMPVMMDTPCPGAAAAPAAPDSAAAGEFFQALVAQLNGQGNGPATTPADAETGSGEESGDAGETEDASALTGTLPQAVLMFLPGAAGCAAGNASSSAITPQGQEASAPSAASALLPGTTPQALQAGQDFTGTATGENSAVPPQAVQNQPEATVTAARTDNANATNAVPSEPSATTITAATQQTSPMATPETAPAEQSGSSLPNAADNTPAQQSELLESRFAHLLRKDAAHPGQQPQGTTENINESLTFDAPIRSAGETAAHNSEGFSSQLSGSGADASPLAGTVQAADSKRQNAENAGANGHFPGLVTGLERPSEQSVPQTSSAALNQAEETHILNQVIEKLSVGRPDSPDRITIKMNPEELGEVTLDLVMDKDHVRVQLSAQNSQVQELLQKHLPRLEQALQNQNLQLDELQVAVDDRGQQDGGSSRQDQASTSPRSFGRAMPGDTVQAAPSATVANTPRDIQQGLSLRI